MASNADITAFEMERNRRVQDNMRRMQELGIFKLAVAAACVPARDRGDIVPSSSLVSRRNQPIARALRSDRASPPHDPRGSSIASVAHLARIPNPVPPLRSPPPKPIRAPTSARDRASRRESLGERRQSLRIASLPTPTYEEVRAEAAKHSEKQQRLSSGGRRTHNTSDWSWEDDDGSNDSFANAAAFARDPTAASSVQRPSQWSPPGPAFVKLMLPSHVSGGYWLQAPYGIGDFLPDTTSTVVLTCDGEEWKTVWLVRSANNGGLSGGWRGFAVDQRLAVGDACVFTKERGMRLRVTIHRAHLCGGDDAAAEKAFEEAERHAEEMMRSSGGGRGVAGDEKSAPDAVAATTEDTPHGFGTSRALHVYSRRRLGRYDASAAAAARKRTGANPNECLRIAKDAAPSLASLVERAIEERKAAAREKEDKERDASPRVPLIPRVAPPGQEADDAKSTGGVENDASEDASPIADGSVGEAAEAANKSPPAPGQLPFASPKTQTRTPRDSTKRGRRGKRPATPAGKMPAPPGSAQATPTTPPPPSTTTKRAKAAAAAVAPLRQGEVAAPLDATPACGGGDGDVDDDADARARANAAACANAAATGRGHPGSRQRRTSASAMHHGWATPAEMRAEYERATGATAGATTAALATARRAMTAAASAEDATPADAAAVKRADADAPPPAPRAARGRPPKATATAAAKKRARAASKETLPDRADGTPLSQVFRSTKRGRTNSCANANANANATSSAAAAFVSPAAVKAGTKSPPKRGMKITESNVGAPGSYLGRRVSCFWRAEARWFEGTLVRWRVGDGYRVAYDDGDVEDGVDFPEDGETVRVLPARARAHA